MMHLHTCAGRSPHVWVSSVGLVGAQCHSVDRPVRTLKAKQSISWDARDGTVIALV
jgi:hypothetical protein